LVLAARAGSYQQRCRDWLVDSHGAPAESSNSRESIERLSRVIGSSINDRRSLLALDAIEQSRVAWLLLVKSSAVGPLLAAPFVSDLVWLKHEVQRVIRVLA